MQHAGRAVGGALACAVCRVWVRLVQLLGLIDIGSQANRLAD